MKYSLDKLYSGIMVNPKLVKQAVSNDPAWKEIFSRMWEISDPHGLQQYALLLRKFMNNQIKDMKGWWEAQSNMPMKTEEELIVFTNPKFFAKLTAISQFIEYLECLDKGQNLASSLGLEEFGPITANKNSRGIRNGGKKRALLMQEEKKELKKKCKSLYDGFRRLSSNLSPHQIHGKIAKELNRSSSWIYKILKDY